MWPQVVRCLHVPGDYGFHRCPVFVRLSDDWLCVRRDARDTPADDAAMARLITSSVAGNVEVDTLLALLAFVVSAARRVSNVP